MTPGRGSFKTIDPKEIHNFTNVPVFEILKQFPQPTCYEIVNEDANNTISYVYNHVTLQEH